MHTDDLGIAKKRLRDGDLTLSVVKDGKTIFETSLHGISGFLEAVEKNGKKLESASAADRVVGKAVALLCLYVKMRAIYAVTLSKKAEALLKENNVYVEWQELVDRILNKDKSDMCPFEKIASDLTEPKEAYAKFVGLKNSLNDKR